MNSLDILAWLDECVSRPAHLCLDSRQIEPGDVFFACPGIGSDGREFIAQALAAGACAVVREAQGAPALDLPVPLLDVPGLAGHLGETAHLWYGRPSDVLTVIAVTGTNGKTSTTQWIAAALNSEGSACGTIGTLGVTLADGRNLGGVLTTPDVLTVHRSLAAIVASGGVAAAIEASSIGLEQGRLDGVRIQVAGFTNLTRDHLDYHGNTENYRQAKFGLFQRPGLRGAVINADDESGRMLLAQSAARGYHQLSYSLQAEDDGAADFRALDIHQGADGLVFNLHSPAGSAQILTQLVGEHNIANLLLVAGVLRELGWGLSRSARALASLQAVPGRLEAVEAPTLGSPLAQPVVLVDYAHTPDALERALVALRPLAQQRAGRLLCLFGCGGDRDSGKRPLMGAVAARLADEVIISSDNPRNEDPQAIIDQVVAGMPRRPQIELDRALAILQTVWRADNKDVILLAGKGHETYQETRGVRSPFDDRQWARLALLWRTPPGIGSDSRSLLPGQIFVAIEGENHDGHKFLAPAQAAGAVAAIVARPVPDCSLPQLVLGDTRRALARLATAWRRQFQIPVIAVTGSNGKTTTKEMIGAILAAWRGADACLVSPGNFNNELGVPLAVLGLRSQHQVAVFELGMNHPGEIGVLARIAQPSVALVNNAQREHQEFMGSVQAVAEENGSVLAELAADGIAVLPAAQTEYFDAWRAQAGARLVRSFGVEASADVSAQNIELHAAGSRFDLRLGPESGALALRIPGRHNVLNALAAGACAWAAGAHIGAVVAGLEAFCAVDGRMQAAQLADGTTLLDDSYNANPDSVRAAIDVLAALGGKRVLVLGDMAEVGAQGPQMHAEVGEYARACGIDALFTLGDLARHSGAAFGAGAQSFQDIDELLARLGAARPAHILVKGSRSMRMERVVLALADAADQEEG